MVARSLFVVSCCCVLGLGRTPDLPPDPPSDLLYRAQAVNDHLFDTLKSFVCDETIERFRGTLQSPVGRQLDTVTSTVSFENGSEHYSRIKQDNHSRPTLASISGAWSEGEFGTLLRQTKQLLAVEPVMFQNLEQLDGEWAAIYEFDVTAADSPWDLVIDSREFHVPFHSKIWISVKSGNILRVSRSSASIPRDFQISEIQWMVSLRSVAMNGASWLLPVTGEYAVSYVGLNRRDWNRLTFLNWSTDLQQR
ncbi:MAG: hypothetical protein M3Y57_10665 [Acidobacteriota bacterium]|nr:hypothetical protein [Acidobacteriota bacterium]